jgi:hypothetical protein
MGICQSTGQTNTFFSCRSAKLPPQIDYSQRHSCEYSTQAQAQKRGTLEEITGSGRRRCIRQHPILFAKSRFWPNPTSISSIREGCHAYAAQIRQGSAIGHASSSVETEARPWLTNRATPSSSRAGSVRSVAVVGTVLSLWPERGLLRQSFSRIGPGRAGPGPSSA